MFTINFKNVFSLLSIIFILSQNVLYGHSFKPEPRGGHMATLVNDRIYFMGGSRPIPKNSAVWSQIHQYNLSDEVFNLDLSSSFNVDLPPFTDLSDNSRIPFGSEKGTAVLGGNGQRIYLIGGVQQNMVTSVYNATNSILWVYTIKTQQWSNSGSGTNGTPLPRRRSTGTIIDSKNVIYIFGGKVELDMGSSVFTIFDDLFTFDTNLLEWKNLSLPNHPSKRSHATATLIPNGRIIYIGGVTQSNPGDNGTRLLMTEIYVFDTIQLTWSLKTAKSPDSVNIDPRVGHTAVLAPDNHTIVIFGGTQDGFAQITAYPAFVLLDVKSEPFQYSAPTPSGQAPPPLAFHTATVYQNYMIVVFGNLTNDFGPSNNASSDVYLMTLSNYSWVTQFKPPDPNPTDNIIIICSIFGILVIIAVVGIMAWYHFVPLGLNPHQPDVDRPE
ncbi:galactose oxidase [Gigaspora margarita]|uniref:Galactose oxidase n=1 Tax=Gigaspora margarita TaxID=4874 RepID=A0A8H4B4R4_GIGMA|nr:galactose oxidase [Gigaspora margarita]